MRYQFYREHKYVSHALNQLERLIAKTDFRESVQVQKVLEEFNSLSHMLDEHAKYEDSALHSLLRKRGSTVHEHIEADHQHQDEWFASLRCLLDKVISGNSSEEKLEWGYRFYLAYRKFVSDNLAHLHEEETIILPELHRLYSDDELRAVEFDTYRQMTPAEMAHMMEELFPHMNASDQEAFVKDLRDSQPQKYAAACELMTALIK